MLQWMRVAFVKVDALAVFSVQIRPWSHIMAVNNEIGSIQPIHEIAALLEDRPTISFHVDAVQAFSQGSNRSLSTRERGLATFSSHKFMVFVELALSTSKKAKDHTPLNGWRSRKMRSTTENVAGIATAKLLRLAMKPSKLLPVRPAR